MRRSARLHRVTLAAVCLSLLGGASGARAALRRIAVVVGNNDGSPAQPLLRFAETDAEKMGAVLTELGGVAPHDLTLLRGQSVQAVRAALARVRDELLERTDSSQRSLLVFYFSGHSDGEALQLGRDRLPFSELRAAIRETGANVRLLVIDSCKSGGILEWKGGRAGPSFHIRLEADLHTSGDVVLTSSARDEDALESRELGGSFFTHHLISGLRGAADVSGDGRVTLTEAYQYAFARTVSATAATVIGPQHPAFRYQLSGQGDLVLTELARPQGVLELPAGFDRFLVLQGASGSVVGELSSPGRTRFAVAPGRYTVRAWRGRVMLAAQVPVLRGTRRVVEPGELEVAPGARGVRKGEAASALETVVSPPSGASPELRVGLGWQAAVARELDGLGSVRIGLRSAGSSGLAGALDLATAGGQGVRETWAILYGGYRLGAVRGPLSYFVGVEAGAGAVLQDAPAVAFSNTLRVGNQTSTSYAVGTVGAGGSSALAAAAPWMGVSVRLTGPLSLGLEGHVPLALLRRDGATRFELLPAAWATLGWAL
jgi:hypothetical protein